MADKDLSNKQLAAGFGGQQEKIIGKLGIIADKLAEQTEAIETEIQTTDLDQRIKDLGGFIGKDDNEDTKDFREAFSTINADLESAIAAGDPEAEAIAKKQLEALEDAVQSEEKRREQEKLLREQNDNLLKMAEGIEGFGKGFDEFAGNVTGSVGFLGTIAGIALLFIDPKKFAKLIGDAISQVSKVLKAIYNIFTGDPESVEAGVNTLKENFGTLAALILTVGLFLGGPLIKGLSALVKAAQVFRLFMVGTFVPTMIAAFTSIATFMAPILAALAPILVPILIIGALIAAIYFGLQAMSDALGFGGVFDSIEYVLAVAGDAFGHLYNMIASLVDWITGIIDSFGGFLGFEFEIPKMGQMDTNSAERKKLELQKKAKERAEEEERKRLIEQEFELQGLDANVDVSEVPDFEGETNALAQLEELQKQNQAGNDILITQADIDAMKDENAAAPGLNMQNLVSAPKINNSNQNITNINQGFKSDADLALANFDR